MNKLYIIFYIIFIPTTILLSFMPYLTRKTENFGVSIPESLYDRLDFKQMRKNYTLLMLILSFIFTLLLLALHVFMSETAFLIGFTVILLIHLFLSFILYLPFHKKMRKVKQNENWHAELKQTLFIDTKFREQPVTHSAWWYIIPILIIMITIGATFALYNSAPEQIPTHTSFSGHVTYSEKSPGILGMLPMIQIFMLLIFIGGHYVIKISKQQVSVEKPKVSQQQNVIFRRRWSLFMIINSIILTGMFTFMQMTMIYQSLLPYQDFIIYPVIIVLLGGTILLSVRMGQGGSRIKITEESNNQVINRDDDRHWKLGQIYFNKHDPSLFVEKRFGIGWTINFARPLALILFLGIILLAFSPLLFL